MSEMTYIKDYKDNDMLRASLDALVKKTFGITFESWYQSGCWDDSYVCRSMVLGDEVIANLSTTNLTWKVDGEQMKAVQIGTVVTRDGYQGRGLNSGLMRKALEEQVDADVFFLFADEDAVPYYEKYGFRPYHMSKYVFEGSFEAGQKLEKAVKMDVSDANVRQRIIEASRNNQINSRFSVQGSEGLLMWYLVNFYSEDIYYIEEIDTYVIGKMDDGNYELVHVISDSGYSLHVLLDYILDQKVKKIIFQFTPQEELGYTVTRMDEPIYIRSKKAFDLSDKQFTLTAKA